MKIVGIDPGIKGGIGIIDGDYKYVAHLHMPTEIIEIPKIRVVEKIKVVDGYEVEKFLLSHLEEVERVIVVVEAIHAMPKQGVSSSLSFGRSHGIVIGIAQTLKKIGAETFYADPAVWKRRLGLSKDKTLSLDLAKRYFPEAGLFKKTKDVDPAEALLLAKYILDQYKYNERIKAH